MTSYTFTYGTPPPFFSSTTFPYHVHKSLCPLCLNQLQTISCTDPKCHSDHVYGHQGCTCVQNCECGACHGDRILLLDITEQHMITHWTWKGKVKNND